MMHWYGNDMNGWGYALMAASTVLIWGLIILGLIALACYFARENRPIVRRLTAEQLQAERFALGEIDEQEYRERSDALRGKPQGADSSGV